MIDIIIGFDFGIKKIGVAIGQRLTYTARPLIVLKSNCGIPNWRHIEKIYHEWKPTMLVVGLPLQSNGKSQSMTVSAIQFAMQLKTRFSILVEMHDERFSTIEAKINQRKYYNYGTYIQEKHQIDAIAAAIILKSWLNQH